MAAKIKTFAATGKQATNGAFTHTINTCLPYEHSLAYLCGVEVRDHDLEGTSLGYDAQVVTQLERLMLIFPFFPAGLMVNSLLSMVNRMKDMTITTLKKAPKRRKPAPVKSSPDCC